MSRLDALARVLEWRAPEVARCAMCRRGFTAAEFAALAFVTRMPCGTELRQCDGGCHNTIANDPPRPTLVHAAARINGVRKVYGRAGR